MKMEVEQHQPATTPPPGDDEETVVCSYSPVFVEDMTGLGAKNKGGRPKKYENDEKRKEARKEQVRQANQRYYQSHKQERREANQRYYDEHRSVLQVCARENYYKNKLAAVAEE
jgi:hypothetical protein